jgi:quercetin 2,3-dioxygenase
MQKKIRNISEVIRSKATLEGAGVHLRRAFGFTETPGMDPFLLLDDFRSNNPDHYLVGFPWHPHRGIETITYMLDGSVEHGDSMGNSGVIKKGEVQWMTAGSGIIHQEMPKGDNAGRMGGFQLWANLPAADKMMAPRYREIKRSQIPEIAVSRGVTIKIVCGKINNTRGPVKDVVTDPQYLDITLEPGTEFAHPTPQGHTVLAYCFQGKARFGQQKNPLVESESLVVFDDGDNVTIATGDQPVRFLLISGKPLHEPVAWYGPIVMNTQKELEIAFREYQDGTFIKAQPGDA